jgi:hypothetical protein
MKKERYKLNTRAPDRKLINSKDGYGDMKATHTSKPSRTAENVLAKLPCPVLSRTYRDSNLHTKVVVVVDRARFPIHLARSFRLCLDQKSF